MQQQRARRRVQRVEQAVAHADVGAGERVQQRRLARVRVAGEGDGGQVRALALGALGGARGLHLVQAALQDRDAVAREAAVGLDLRLARAAGADAADAAAGAEALEVRPQAAHARHVVFELGELDLHLALGRVGVAGEDVEDHRGAVEHRHVELGLEVALLARRELVVGDDEVRVRLLEQRLELVDLARAQVVVRVRLVALLHHLADGGDAGGPQQLLELLEILVVGRGGDAVGALLGPAGVGRRGVAGLGCAAVARAFQDHSILESAARRCPSRPRPARPSSLRSACGATLGARRHPVASRAAEAALAGTSAADVLREGGAEVVDLGDSCVLAYPRETRPRRAARGPPGHGAGAGQPPRAAWIRTASTGSARAT